MRCFRPPRWNRTHWKKTNWKRAWSKGTPVPWTTCFWSAKSPTATVAMAEATTGSVSSPELTAPPPATPKPSFSFSQTILNPLTTLLLAATLFLVIGGWSTFVIYSLRQAQSVSTDVQQPLSLGVPSQLVLDEGVQKFPWLKDYKLNQPNLVEGNETLLITSTAHATRDQALEEARHSLSQHILQRMGKRFAVGGTLSREDLISYFPTHEGTLEKSITVGKFTEPMYRVYLLATIPEVSLTRLHGSLQDALLMRRAHLLLASILMTAGSIFALVIAFRVDLATQGRRRWIGNLAACTLLLLLTGSAAIGAKYMASSETTYHSLSPASVSKIEFEDFEASVPR